MEIKFLSRPNCELCEDGLRTLRLVREDVDFEINVINIEEDDTLHEKYMIMIPVVIYEDNILQYGRLDYVTLLEQIVERNS